MGPMRIFTTQRLIVNSNAIGPMSHICPILCDPKPAKEVNFSINKS